MAVGAGDEELLEVIVFTLQKGDVSGNLAGGSLDQRGAFHFGANEPKQGTSLLGTVKRSIALYRIQINN